MTADTWRDPGAGDPMTFADRLPHRRAKDVFALDEEVTDGN